MDQQLIFSPAFAAALNKAKEVPTVAPLVHKLQTEKFPKLGSNHLDYNLTDDGSKLIITALPTNAKTNAPFSSVARSTLKFASFVQKLTNCPQAEARNLIETLKSNLILNLSVSVVSGEEIRHWYDRRNAIAGAASGSANIYSCMTDRASLPRLDFYVANKNIQLAVVLQNGKAIARCLLFHGFASVGDCKTGKNPIVAAGRIYASASEARKLLINWAKVNGYYRMEGSALYPTGTLPKIQSIFVPVEHPAWPWYPYFDHMAYYNKEVQSYTNCPDPQTSVPISQLWRESRAKLTEPWWNPLRPKESAGVNGQVITKATITKQKLEWVPGNGWAAPINLTTCSVPSCGSRCLKNRLAYLTETDAKPSVVCSAHEVVSFYKPGYGTSAIVAVPCTKCGKPRGGCCSSKACVGMCHECGNRISGSGYNINVPDSRACESCIRNHYKYDRALNKYVHIEDGRIIINL